MAIQVKPGRGFVGALALGTMLLAACGGTSPTNATPSAGSGGPTIAFGYQATSWGAPMVVAQKINAWNGLAVNVKTTALSAGTAVTQGLLGGSLQAGSLGSTPFVVGAAKGKLVAVAVVAYAGATDAVVVKKGSPITSIAALRGKKIATQIGSSTNDIFVSKIAPKYGLSKNDYTLVNTTFQNMYSLLATGQVDAFLGVEPSPALAVEKGTGSILTTYLNYDPTPLYLTFTQQFVKSHPQAVVQFLQGWLKVVREFKSNPTEAARLSQSAFGASGVQISKSVLESSVNALQINPQFASNTQQYLTSQAQALVKQGSIPSVPDWSTSVDSSYLRQAAKASGYVLTQPTLS